MICDPWLLIVEVLVRLLNIIEISSESLVFRWLNIVLHHVLMRFINQA